MFGLQLLRLTWQYFLRSCILRICWRDSVSLSIAFRNRQGRTGGIGVSDTFSVAFGLSSRLLFDGFQGGDGNGDYQLSPGAALQIILTPIAFWPVLRKVGQADQMPARQHVAIRSCNAGGEALKSAQFAIYARTVSGDCITAHHQ